MGGGGGVVCHCECRCDREEDLLDLAPFLSENSRLGELLSVNVEYFNVYTLSPISS